jgi:hypothetical protein
MEIIGVISDIGTLIVAFVGIWIAIAQLRSANRDAHASRMAEMSWQVYQAYVDPRLRDARGAAEHIARTVPIPSSGVEYGERYADKKIIVKDPEKESLDTLMRRLLRFYNQVGILVEKKLVDDDLVFALIGPGLKSAWPAVAAAIDWYQNYYGGPSGHEKTEPRPIHAYVTKLYEHYLAWEAVVKGIAA